MVVGGRVVGILGKDSQMLCYAALPLFNHPPLLQSVTLLVSDQSPINKVAVSVCNAAGQPGSSAYNPTHLKQILEIGASVLPEPSVL